MITISGLQDLGESKLIKHTNSPALWLWMMPLDESDFQNKSNTKFINLTILIKFAQRTELSLSPGCITDYDLNT
jgi:hypothetical protein